MPQKGLSLCLALALVLALLVLIAPSVAQTSPAYFTTTVVSTGMKQTTLGGFSGVLLNYTNTLSSPLTTLVYMDVLNSVGQVAGVNAATCNFAANQTVSCFIVFPSSVHSGNYSVQVFATTASGVPVSEMQVEPVQI